MKFSKLFTFIIAVTICLCTLIVAKASFVVEAQQLSDNGIQIFLPIIVKPLPEPQLLQTKPVWKALFIIYRDTDVDYIDNNGIAKHFTLTMPEEEFQNGLWAQREFASIANDFSNGEAVLVYDTVIVDRPINSITYLGPSGYWLSPDDTHIELDLYAPAGKYDSILVYWPAFNTASGELIPSYGWGYALQASSWSNNATYAVVWNAPSYWWGSPPITGQVWVHEWLHAVCNFYSTNSYRMPNRDADGGESHGYEYSPITGWASYYRDLMTGKVLEDEIYTGIVPSAWRSGSILDNQYEIFTDYYFTDTLSGYTSLGTASWDSTDQNILLGNSIARDNRFYKSITFDQSATISGRVYLPYNNTGIFDSVAIALKNDRVEYWATLAYGSSLNERNHISIIRDDTWGSLYPIDLTPGWYTIKVKLDYSNNTINMKTWRDGHNEPTWQLSDTLDSGWYPRQIGFRHYGQGSIIDDLIVVEAP